MKKTKLEMQLVRKNFKRSRGSFKGEENSIKATEVKKMGTVFRTKVWIWLENMSWVGK